jgi:diguanylate cyclase (GGDEF)-like protein/PAS domain S-box-containing protein
MSLNLPENSDSLEQQAILNALPALVFLEQAGQIVFANTEARQMLEMAEGEWVPRPVEEVLWGLLPGTAEPQTLLTATGQGSPFHATLPVNGRLLPVEGAYSILDAERRQAIIVAHPGGREHTPKPRLMEDVLASIPDAVVIIHGNNVLYTNSAFTRMFGYTAEEVSGGNLRDLIVPETRQHENALLQKAVDQQGGVTIETVRMNKSGELVDVGVVIGPLIVDGKKVGYVFTYREIGERKQKEAQLQHDAMHDVLTGLPNRSLFLDRMNHALTRRARRNDQNCGVLFLDIDRFKEINDSLGHAAGDALLVEVARRLRAALRPQDSAARLGGDEFAVLVENILSVADLNIVARRVLSEMDRPFDLFGHSIRAGASIGAAMAGPEHTAGELLIRDADLAMYRAKEEGGGRFEVFDKHLEISLTSQQNRERELRHVLDQRQFELWYQPFYRLQTGKLEGFESLLRWRRTNGSMDSFRDLLPIAEDTGLSISIGRETVDTVCRQLRTWAGALPASELVITVNVSHRQFYHPDMVAQLRLILAETGVDPSRLLFEVSETTLNENPDAAVVILQRMVDCNVRIAIDNFGSSLAPLNHLVRLPIDMIKIAPKLTAAATGASRQLAVLESLIRLGRTLGIQVVAQGIETSAQLDVLRAMGCELGQGFYFSHALEPARALKLVELGFWPPRSQNDAGSVTDPGSSSV